MIRLVVCLVLLQSYTLFSQNRNVRCADGKPPCYGDTVISLTKNLNRVCNGGEITFTNKSSHSLLLTDDNIHWNFCYTGGVGAACPAFGQTKTYQFNFFQAECQKIQRVELMVTYPNGRQCCKIDTIYQVNYHPVITTSAEAVCANGASCAILIADNLNSCQRGGTNWRWRDVTRGINIPNNNNSREIKICGQPSTNPPTYPPGKYKVYTDINGASGCKDSTAIIEVRQLPKVSEIKINNSQADTVVVCRAENVRITYAGCERYMIQQLNNIPDFVIEGAISPSINPNDGSITVRYELPNNTIYKVYKVKIGDITRYIAVVFNQILKLDVSADSTVCRNRPITFTDLSTCNTYLTPKFSFSGTLNIDYTIPQSGAVTFLTVGPKQVCMRHESNLVSYVSPTICRMVNVTGRPNDLTGISGPTSVCPGQTGILYTANGNITGHAVWQTYDSNSDGNNNTLQIQNQQGNPNTINTTNNFSSGRLCVKDENACGPGKQSCINIVSNASLPAPIIQKEPCPECRLNEKKYSAFSNGADFSTEYDWVLAGNSDFVQSFTLGSYSVDANGKSTVIVKSRFAFLSSRLCVSALNCDGFYNEQSCVNINGSGVFRRTLPLKTRRTLPRR